MRKMWNLVVNEHVKIFAKISTIIMLILIIVLAAGYNVLMYAQNQFFEVVDRFPYTEDYGYLIQMEKEMKDSGWEIRVEQYTFLQDQGISSYEDWRYDAVSKAYGYKLEASFLEEGADKSPLMKNFDTLIAIVKEKDWKKYLSERKSILQADKDMPQEEKDIRLWSIQYRLDHDIGMDYGNWKSNLLYEVEANKIMAYQEAKKPYAQQDHKSLKEYNEKILIGSYRLENGIKVFTQPDNENTASMGDGFNFWTVFQNSILLVSIINVLIIIVAGSTISSEFSTGTVKFLLINPVKRWKILVAKYISIISIALLMLAVYYVFNAILSGIFFGFQDFGAPHLFVSGGKVHTGSSFLFVAWKYLLGSLSLLTMATFAFALSSLVRSSALAIGLGIAMMLGGNAAVLFLGEALKQDWARYLIFANTNLNTISMQGTPFVGHTVEFALIVIAVYMVVFFLTAWDGFMKRDIK